LWNSFRALYDTHARTRIGISLYFLTPPLRSFPPPNPVVLALPPCFASGGGNIAPIKAVYDEIRAQPGFDTTNAVKNKKIFLIGNDIHSCPGYIATPLISGSSMQGSPKNGFCDTAHGGLILFINAHIPQYLL
jgi:hypothetical protein